MHFSPANSMDCYFTKAKITAKENVSAKEAHALNIYNYLLIQLMACPLCAIMNSKKK